MFPARQHQLLSNLSSSGLDALVLNPGPSLTYLTGLHFHLSERPTVLLMAPGVEPVLVLPELEVGKVSNLPFTVQAFTYGDNPETWGEAFERAGAALDLGGKTIGVEPKFLRVLELRFLEAALPDSRFVSAEKNLAGLRLRKDAAELAAMRQAVRIAQEAFSATLPLLRAGMQEQEVATELTFQLLRAGSAPEMPFMPIAASGPNSANPHHAFSDKPLTPGDLVVIDWGASYQGYFSDLTRTLAVQEVEPKLAQIAEVVHQANAAGRQAGKPGIPAGQVDRAARQVIEAAGYGSYFIHRTGHGLGMEIHEEPYMFGDNPLQLEPGMVYTVEPGIYLPGVGGVRIEDDVTVTAGGSESLSDLPRDLYVIA